MLQRRRASRLTKRVVRRSKGSHRAAVQLLSARLLRKAEAPPAEAAPEES